MRHRVGELRARPTRGANHRSDGAPRVRYPLASKLALGRARRARPGAGDRARPTGLELAKFGRMQAPKVQIKNGWGVLDDDLSADERAALHASLDRALDDSEAGRGVDAAEYLAQYRVRRATRPACR